MMNSYNGAIVAIILAVLVLILILFHVVFVIQRRHRNLQAIELNCITPGPPILTTTRGYQPRLADQSPRRVRFASLDHPRHPSIVTRGAPQVDVDAITALPAAGMTDTTIVSATI